MIFSNKQYNQRGTFLIVILMFGAVVSLIVVGGISTYALSEHRASKRYEDSDLAFHIAEAGVNYYRWHLLHSPGDYKDGTGLAGPYVHEYKDKGGETVGSFSLTITPPQSGSEVITIRSTGVTLSAPNTKRTVEAEFAFSSIAAYAFVSNVDSEFGPDDVVHGVVHSNGQIRFDGTSDSWVESAQSSQGVWGGGHPKTLWRYPVDPVDFTSISVDLAALRTSSDNGGVHLSSSGVQGWHLVFSGTTFTAKKVLTRDSYRGEGRLNHRVWEGQTYAYDLGSEQTIQSYSIPANGVIFVDDDVWVDGVVDGRVSIGAGRFPVQQGSYRNIYVSGNITYAGTDDVLGLFAQGDVIVPYEVPDEMTISAAMLSQYGKVHRPYYDSSNAGNRYERESLSLFGSQMSFLGGQWRYWDSSGQGNGNTTSGFESTTYTYDGNLRLSPPPGFPMGKNLEMISWEEIE